MPNFDDLKTNSDFPKISNVDTYKYDNEFDYSRFNAIQMELQICTVPWDMGEAHIGNRTISGIGNVVYFGSKEKRDVWFDAIPDNQCYRFETKFKELHREHIIDVPIPYDMCAKHNYLVVRYSMFANENSPVMYEGTDGLREWFWFIREVEFIAPNNTRLHLLDDAFQTWIYDIDITGMILERGHAPMFAMKAKKFLENPIERNDYLLTDDVNYGEAEQVKHIGVAELNAGTMYACIATTANPNGTWTDKTPASAYYMNNGAPSVYVFAIAASNLNSFLSKVDSTCPQFKQTIQAVFFVSTTLLTLGGTFTFCNTTCYGVNSSRKTFDLVKLDKSLFGYDERYTDIAKLYTSPYAHIEIADENGNVDIVKIEDTTGKIQLSAMLSLAYPFINVDAHLLGVGGSASKSVTFKNIYNHSINIQGRWYETLRSWNVPTFAVIQDAAIEYDYSTRFDRAQRVVDYTAAQNNENANADNEVANATVTTTANTAVTARSNTSAAQAHVNTFAYNIAVATDANAVIAGSAQSTIAANEMQGAIAAASGAATSVVSGIASGNPASAAAGIINGLIGAGTTLAQTSVANGLTAAQAGYSQTANSNNSSNSNSKSNNDTQNQMDTASDICDLNNTATTTHAANNSATRKANATRTANAAQSAIDNDVAQAALGEPKQYGSFANGESAVTKPMATFAHIVTQSRSAISSAGDEFLRYGYMYDKQWDFNGNWNIGKYFTYWKLKDFWVKNLNVPDMYMDKIRFFLFGGVTVWRNPDDIGRVGVYENFNG